MHPIVAIIIMLVGGAGAFWLALVIYGMMRKDKKTDLRRSKVRLTETGDSDAGGGDGGGH
jgi:hypothetical protein